MNRQVAIFALVFSMMFVAASAKNECIYRCMACLMIGDQYCAMDVAYPSGGEHCLNFCHVDESSLPRGTIYGVINAVRNCRKQGANADACMRKLTA